MNKRVHCGRLVAHKDGIVKKLPLANGGGTRDCSWDSIDMDWDEIHERIRKVFLLDQTKQKSSLYDFQCKPLDMTQYRTFFEYIHKNGLKFNGTLLYLCTSAVDTDDIVKSVTPEKRKTTAVTPQVVHYPVQPKKKIPQVEADSSTSPVLIKIDDEPTSSDNKSTNESSLTKKIAEKLRISSTTLFSDYSFEKSLYELVDYLRSLISENNPEKMFVQVFEYVCTIRGLASTTLDQIKRQRQVVDKQKQDYYNGVLDKIEKSCRSIKALLELNKMKVSPGNHYSITMDSFVRFHLNFNILRDQWFNRKIIPPSEKKPSKNSTALTSFSSSRRPTQSSSRSRSKTNPRKQARALSPSPHRPSSSNRVSTTEKDEEEKATLFEQILRSLNHLSEVLQSLRFSAFFHLLKSMINEIKSFQSTMNLSDCRSLSDAEQMIVAIEKCLTIRMNGEYNRLVIGGVDWRLKYAFDTTLDAIQNLLASIRQYQSQLNTAKRPRRSRWSTPIQQEPISNKSEMNSNAQDTKMEVDQSSDESHSSFGDEVLMEVAKDAYEQRPNRHK